MAPSIEYVKTDKYTLLRGQWPTLIHMQVRFLNSLSTRRRMAVRYRLLTHLCAVSGSGER